MQRRSNSFCMWLAIIVAAGCPAARGQERPAISDDQRQTLQGSLRSLQNAIEALGKPSSQTSDAAVFAKGLEWALKYDAEFTDKDLALLEKAVTRGRQRVEELQVGTMSWMQRKGPVALGYVSRVDGSVQPYGLIVPQQYDPAAPIRLDVVLHGSTRPVGISELRFLARFDPPDGLSNSQKAAPPDQPFIELHPLGRVENCYRWAGETDVFEAIEDVCRRYNIDRRRIVLRGMSMGASGTWHLGLKHPDRFVALGPYCGYVDTHHFSETPLANFVKVGPLPEHQERGLHMLDSIDYAANAGVVPAIACMGEKDVFFHAHVLMGEAMQREGLTLVNLISPGTGHVIDPVTHAEQMRRIGEYAAGGLNERPRELRFVTWTLKYGRCHWLQLLGLERHYARAEFAARVSDEVLDVTKIGNITRFAVDRERLPAHPQVLRIGTTELKLPPASADGSIVVVRQENAWTLADASDPPAGKRPGLQGPIDDAFTAPFLCVRGTGRPWNQAVHDYCEASLKRFADEWQHYFRGDSPLKDDTAVTPQDLQTRNLILFGDPGSNPWIAQALPQLPLAWSRETLQFGGHDYPADRTLPALIAPNPLDPSRQHYVVLNSGHTFREFELAKLNYLLFPRWGDWAIVEVDPAQRPSSPLDEKILRAGYFDEQWRALR